MNLTKCKIGRQTNLVKTSIANVREVINKNGWDVSAVVVFRSKSGWHTTYTMHTPFIFQTFRYIEFGGFGGAWSAGRHMCKFPGDKRSTYLHKVMVFFNLIDQMKKNVGTRFVYAQHKCKPAFYYYT